MGCCWALLFDAASRHLVQVGDCTGRYRLARLAPTGSSESGLDRSCAVRRPSARSVVDADAGLTRGADSQLTLPPADMPAFTRTFADGRVSWASAERLQAGQSGTGEDTLRLQPADAGAVQSWSPYQPHAQLQKRPREGGLP